MSTVQFVKSFYNIQDKPKLKLPEIVLCGRSNVGKSSFINSFFNRKDLAKVSSSPGKTRTINYYIVNEKFYIVDLPGFGYAKVPKSEKAKWERSITSYLAQSQEIVTAMHFIDSRHKPTKLDEELNHFLLEYNIDFKVVLTKVDKLKQSEKSKILREMKTVFPDFVFNKDIFFYSSVKGTGKQEIKKLISELVNVRF